MEQTPITSSALAVNYARATAPKPTSWPRYIYLDENNLPTDDANAKSFIYVARTVGRPAPSPEYIILAEACKRAARQSGVIFLDFIILGTGMYYSFADETCHYVKCAERVK